MVLDGRKQAGGVGGERAGGTVGEVEIEKNFMILDRLGIKVSAGRISLPAAGQILELEEEFFVFDLGDV